MAEIHLEEEQKIAVVQEKAHGNPPDAHMEDGAAEEELCHAPLRRGGARGPATGNARSCAMMQPENPAGGAQQWHPDGERCWCRRLWISCASPEALATSD